MPDRPSKPFRIGITRGSTGEYKPIATVGVSSDGGIFVAPAAVRNYGWMYGLSSAAGGDFSRPLDLAHTSLRPKLHYHRSGIASATLTGKEMERRQMRFPPITAVRQSQVLSLVAQRTWELQSDPKGSRKGDTLILSPSWPESVAVSLSLLKGLGAKATEHPESPAGIGLVAGDDSRFSVDFSSFLPDTHLIGRVSIGTEPAPMEPSITVGAVSWAPGVDPMKAESFVLYSDSLKYPIIWRDADQPSEREFHRLLTSDAPVLLGTPEEHMKRIFGTKRQPPA